MNTNRIRIAKTVFLIVLFLVSQLPINAQQSSTLDTLHLADPTIFTFGKKYYLYGTNDGGPGGFKVYISDDLKRWKLSEKNDGYALKKGESYGDKGFWAPQVFRYRNKFYMAYAANEQLAIAEADDPAGPFTQKRIHSIPAEGKQIDPFVYFGNSRIYLYHVRLTNGNRIFVAEMNEDLSAMKESTLKECVSSILPWENTANAKWPVCEGPSVLKRDGLYYLFYSSNDFRNPDYAVGYATSKSPMGPWVKYEGNPVINRSMLGISGPGHGDFFADNQGGLEYVLHTHNSDSKVGPRNTAIIKMDIRKGKVSIDKSSFQFAGLYHAGCWESSAIQLPSGQIQLYFSDEAIYTESDEQNISVLYSQDNGNTWTKKPQIISFRKGSRDGMPVAIYLTEQKKIALAIEDPGIKHFKPYILTSAENGKWNTVISGENGSRNYALAKRLPDTTYAGAPFLRRLSTGETIMAYQSCEGRLTNRDNNAVMQVAVGSKNASEFMQVPVPFSTPEGLHSLWNSLCILNDDTIVAITSTNAYSKGRSEIWMIKGKLTRN